MRSWRGALALAAVALFLGVLVVSQFRSREAASRSLQLETPESLATLVASLTETNRQLREEIFDLRIRLELAQRSVASGQGAIAESEQQLEQLRVFSARTAVGGPGVSITIDGAFDERALSDLVNELRNAGAEAIAVNAARVGPRSWFGLGEAGALVVDGAVLRGPWTVRAIGDPDVLRVAMTRTGGIVGQFELIYQGTRFTVREEVSLELPALGPGG